MNGTDTEQAQASRFFEQHPLPQGGPGVYEVTRRFRIVVKGAEGPAGPGEPLQQLSLVLLSLDEEPGTPKAPGAEWKDLVAEMLGPKLVDRGNPLDFAIFKTSRVAIQLTQQFLRFSPKMAPLTTKKKHPNGKYYDLRLHTLTDAGFVSETEIEWRQNRPDTPCRCISFFTRDPDHASSGTRDGFSMNVDLVGQEGGLELVIPITIDPDIENKGGNDNLLEDAPDRPSETVTI